VLFAVEPEREAEVRALLDRALAGGDLVGPDGMTTRWKVLSSSPGTVTASEHDHAQRLIRD
jgi:hypothetical protein